MLIYSFAVCEEKCATLIPHGKNCTVACIACEAGAFARKSYGPKSVVLDNNLLV